MALIQHRENSVGDEGTDEGAVGGGESGGPRGTFIGCSLLCAWGCWGILWVQESTWTSRMSNTCSAVGCLSCPETETG